MLLCVLLCLGAWDKSSVIRFVLDFLVHFAGFEGEYPLVFNRETREMGGKRRRKDDDGTFVPSSQYNYGILSYYIALVNGKMLGVLSLWVGALSLRIGALSLRVWGS